ncbi:MAG: 30S ribosomal protein S6 [Marinimicrobia bacterium 46_43]|nr:MAG: 30S ribosomal protein S6 [Marinimicrobia bacterium 46_43]
MRYYETLFIVHPNYEQERLNSVIKMVEGHIAEIGGHVLAVDDWGKRRLAYPIEKQKSGNYVLIYFEAEPSAVVELQTWFELQAQILAQLIVRLDEKPAGVPSHHEDDDDEDQAEMTDESSADDESDEDYVEDEDEDEEEEKEDDSEETSEEAVKETV